MRKQGVTIFAVSVLAFFAVASAAGVITVAGSAASLYDHLISAKTNIAAGDMAFAQEDIRSARESLARLQKAIRFFSFAKAIPGISENVSAAEKIARAGDTLLDAFDTSLSVASNAIHVFYAPSGRNLESVTALQKKKIVREFLKALPTLVGVNANVTLALSSIKSIDDGALMTPLKMIKGELLDKGTALARLFTLAGPLIEAGPQIAGFSGERTYLLLLQNNTEVRATGGFIGTYGILKVKDGEISYVRTDNVYNLDDRAPSSLKVKPPRPFLEYFPPKERWWYLRDSNWSPDFSDVADTAQWFYAHEGGKEHLDGVIAFTPDVIASLLTIVGPIDVSGVRFTSENFVDELQYQVEKGIDRAGITERNRKEIVGTIMRSILDRAYAIKTDRLKNLSDLFRRQLDEKHILLYFNDPSLQDVARMFGWSGEIRSAVGDYLMVIDSNMGSLKTDSVMKKSIRYSLTENKDSSLIARLEMTYQNNGRYSWKTTDYKDYVRAYAPDGSTLLRAEGAMTRNGTPNTGALDTTAEHGTVSFGSFIQVPIGKTRTLVLEYELPKRIKEQVAAGLYTLAIQKQSGLSTQEFVGSFQFIRPIKQKGTSMLTTLEKPNRAILKSTSYTDQSIALEF